MTETVLLAGRNGMVGSAIYHHLQSEGVVNIVTPTRKELDLGNQGSVNEFFSQHKFSQVYMAAARVGGIHANDTYPADFIYENLLIECNLIHACHLSGIEKLLFLGSSCIYPRIAEQPMKEEALLAGPLEPTNEPYAIAKIAGIKLCESYNRQYGHDYRCVMPTNLYGPGDNFHPENSHVIPALLQRFHEAKINGDKEIVVWGSGNPRREFLHVDDMAAACIHIMNIPREKLDTVISPRVSHINIGTGEDCAIKELAKTIQQVVGYTGKLTFDTSKPDGAPRKLLDVSKLHALGWKHAIALKPGLRNTYEWFVTNQDQLRTS